MKNTKELLTETIKTLDDNREAVNKVCTNLGNYKSLLKILQESRECDDDLYSVLDIVIEGLERENDFLGDVHIQLHEGVTALSEKLVDEDIVLILLDAAKVSFISSVLISFQYIT